MGNSTSSGLGSGSARGFRDVRTANPDTEVERPPASPALIKKSLPVLPKSYIAIHSMLTVAILEYGFYDTDSRKVRSAMSATAGLIVKDAVCSKVKTTVYKEDQNCMYRYDCLGISLLSV